MMMAIIDPDAKADELTNNANGMVKIPYKVVRMEANLEELSVGDESEVNKSVHLVGFFTLFALLCKLSNSKSSPRQ